MHRRALLLVALAPLGCKSEPAVLTSPPVAGRPTTEPPPPAEEEEEEDLPPLEQVCAGTHLDLRWIAGVPDCNYDGENELPWPAAITSSLSPSTLTLTADATGYLDYVLANDSPNEVTFDIPYLGCYDDLEVRILDAKGERMRKGCGGMGGCGAPTVRITLAPRGDARFRLPVHAKAVAQGWEGNRCVLEDGPLPPDDYTLEPSAQFDGADELPQSRLIVTEADEAERAFCIDASGCVEAGLGFQTGYGAPRDDVGARRAYGRACDLGEGLGCSMLADMQTGEDAERSLARAAVAFGLACDVGSPGDCYQLGFLLEAGKGVKRDHAAAVRVHRRAYAGYFDRCRFRDDLDGCDMAGKVARGEILDDEAMAKGAYETTLDTREQRCNGGDLETCKDLGIQFRDGKGVERDEARALELLLKACEGGLEDDCNLAASLLKHDDLDRAVELYGRACKAGNPFACDFEKMYCRSSSLPCPD